MEIVKEKLSDGRILIRQTNSEIIPKDHHWLLILKKIKDSGMVDKFKYVYSNKTMDKPLMLAYDEERGGIGVQKPDKVLLIKTEKQGYWEEDKVIGEIDFRVWADPDIEQSLRILKLVKEL